MKHPRKKVAVVAGLLVLAAVAGHSLMRSHEVYAPLPQFQTEAALREWATNSIPLLLEWLRLDQTDHKPAAFVLVANRLLDKQKLIKFRIGSTYRPNRTQFAYDILCTIGADGKAALPGLITLLGNKSERVSASACLILEKMTPASIPVLTEVLGKGNERARALAATALQEIGPDAKMAMPALRERLADQSLAVRFAAASALASLGTPSPEALKVILEGITRGDPETRDNAFTTLGRLGAGAQAAVPGLVSIITNTTTGEPQRFGTLWTLRSIDRSELIRAVAGLSNTGLRSNIVTKLRSFDPQTAAEMQAKVASKQPAP